MAINNCSVLTRRSLERLDLLLLVIESLDLNASQAMTWTSAQLGLEHIFPNPVELWKRRCHNPLRRTSRRGKLNVEESEALMILLCAMAQRLYPLLHQLLSSKEPESINSQRWQLLNQRFSDLLIERMNIRKGAVQRLLNRNYFETNNKQLVLTLAICAGPGGLDRLRANLLDESP